MTETVSSRIVAEIKGTLRPLYPTSSEGACSPSASLLIEAHPEQISDWQTRTIRGQILTLFVDPGQVLHCIDNGAVSRIAIPSHSVVMSLRDELESISWLKGARVLSVQLEDRVLAEAAASYGIHKPIYLAASRGVRDPRLSALLQALRIEQANQFQCGPLFVDGIENALAALLVCGYAADVKPSGNLERTLPPAREKQIKEFIHAYLHLPLTLNDLAKCAGYSPSHFSRLFRGTFGMTPHRFTLCLRVERAKKLLRHTKLSMLEIALHCGFQTSQHFARVFKQHAGLPPRDFRDRG